MIRPASASTSNVLCNERKAKLNSKRQAVLVCVVLCCVVMPLRRIGSRHVAHCVDASKSSMYMGLSNLLRD